MTADVIAVRRTAARSPGRRADAAQDRYTVLPVVESDGRLVGLVSEADALGDPLYGRVRRRTVGA